MKAFALVLALAACSGGSSSPHDGGSVAGGPDGGGGPLPSWCANGGESAIGYALTFPGQSTPVQRCLGLENGGVVDAYVKGTSCQFAQTNASAAGGSSSATVLSNDMVFAQTGPVQLMVGYGEANSCPYGSDSDCTGNGMCMFNVTQAGPLGSEVTAVLAGDCQVPLQLTGLPDEDAGGPDVTFTTMVVHGTLVAVTSGGTCP